LAVKAGLIVADPAGSAVVRVGAAEASVAEWIDTAFASQLTAHDAAEKVIKQRIDEIKRRQGSFRGLHDFQVRAADLGPRALLLSGCGTGKTLAAWKWIEVFRSLSIVALKLIATCSRLPRDSSGIAR
jgi:CRISPR-associated endonuclease/helicase Cas3